MTILDFLGGILGATIVLAVLFGPPIWIVATFARFLRESEWRLHLSTLVIASILVALFLGLNLSRHRGGYFAYTPHETIDVRGKYYGWPFKVFVTIDGDSVPANTVLQDVDYSYEKLATGDYLVDDGVYGDSLCTFWNVLIALAATLFVCRRCERYARRKRAALIKVPV